jgi:hypothetical protein
MFPLLPSNVGSKTINQGVDMKSIRRVACTGMLILGMAAFLPVAQAADTFQGRVSSVDKSSQSVVVNGQTYHILASSQIKQNGQAASINDLAAGEQVSGQYKKSAENRLEVLTMDVTAGQNTAQGGTSSATTTDTTTGSSFNGTVSKVDTSAKTVTIGGQTYHVLATSRLMKDNKPASLNEIRVGQQISGNYKTSAENRMEVLTADISGTRSAANTGGTQERGTTEAGAQFSGKVSKVNLGSQTVIIGNQTYQLLPTTVVTSVKGRNVTMANLKADQDVSGTYKKSAEGKRELLTLHIEKNN